MKEIIVTCTFKIQIPEELRKEVNFMPTVSTTAETIATNLGYSKIIGSELQRQFLSQKEEAPAPKKKNPYPSQSKEGKHWAYEQRKKKMMNTLTITDNCNGCGKEITKDQGHYKGKDGLEYHDACKRKTVKIREDD
ncbi:Uncharacterised protein [Candidatus Anstonella stagnisolia]|nr:Uncharacterised protein [Candidatus Anstonella stagnisolia]